MKTQKMKSNRIALFAVLMTALLTMVACGTKQEKTANEKDSSPVAETKVQAPNMDIHAATILGDLEAIQQHIQAGSDLNAKEPAVGSTALITAAVFGKTEIAKALIEAGADVNLKNNEGSTALHSAAFVCRLEIVELLLANGANKDVVNNYGSTALQSISAPFADVKPFYDQMSKDLGPLGFKLDYEYLEATRPIIAGMLR